MLRLSALVLLGLLAMTTEALANGRYPATNKITVQPGNPDVLILRTTFGFLLSRDRGKNWDWICEVAVGSGGPDASLVEDPSVALTANGSIIVGTQSGLTVSTDGCSWPPSGGVVAGKVITDLTIDPSDTHTALALGTQIFESKNDGQAWAPMGVALDATVTTLTIDVAKTDPQRVYVTATRGAQSVIFVSANRGGSWVEHSIPVTTSETGAYIGAIDPANADRVYVRTSSALATRLLVSDDGGKTFVSRYDAGGALSGFALSPDGTKVWVGGSSDGIQMAHSSDFVFKPISSLSPRCLTSTDTILYGCFLGDIAAESKDQGTTFAGLLRLCSIRGPLSCSNDANAVCTSAWPALKTGLAIPCTPPPEPSSGIDSGADAGITPPPPPSGCGCTTGSGSAAWFGVVVVIALSRRRKR